LRELALHILDIAENSISAGADSIKIKITEDHQQDILKIVIDDNGGGMDQETVEKITDPFITSRTTRKVGLGLPFFKAAAEACEGSFSIKSKPGVGTTVTAVFKHSHIDRMPLGDIISTLHVLIIGTPHVNFILQYQIDGKTFRFDDAPIKQTLQGVPLSEPAVMKYVREELQAGIESLDD
jgi:anti-sigma regulatory factor (Ser/Thr protein kinase)